MWVLWALLNPGVVRYQRGWQRPGSAVSPSLKLAEPHECPCFLPCHPPRSHRHHHPHHNCHRYCRQYPHHHPHHRPRRHTITLLPSMTTLCQSPSPSSTSSPPPSSPPSSSPPPSQSSCQSFLLPETKYLMSDVNRGKVYLACSL